MVYSHSVRALLASTTFQCLLRLGGGPVPRCYLVPDALVLLLAPFTVLCILVVTQMFAKQFERHISVLFYKHNFALLFFVLDDRIDEFIESFVVCYCHRLFRC
jgi:hypothetical protein